jgi:hypothetical protein
MTENSYNCTFSHAFVVSPGAKPDSLIRICDDLVTDFGDEQLREEGKVGFYGELAVYSSQEIRYGKRAALSEKAS